jgi:hypothetical protein
METLPGVGAPVEVGIQEDFVGRLQLAGESLKVSPEQPAIRVRVWRIAKHTKDFKPEDLSGAGTTAVGGRWNGVGQPVVYARTSIALCTQEKLEVPFVFVTR